jgi:hypothetical protein
MIFVHKYLDNKQDTEDPHMSKNHVSSPIPPSSGYAPGPLVVCTTNPRYFTAATDSPAEQKAIYLTGSHIWNNFHDGLGPGLACSEEPEQNDYGAYLAFLKEHGHNFIRLWRWEQFKSQAATANFHLCMTPQPWLRIGPGLASDGKPKFDLSRFDPLYFDRLRERIIAAGNEGIYVSVMLFDGFGLHLSQAPDHIEGHPFFAANNSNGIALTSINEYQVLPLDPRVQALQEAYICKVIDTVADLPNVLYEVANESAGGGQVDRAFADVLGLSDLPSWGDSTAWQYWVIAFVKRYEQQMGHDQHPIGMTMQFPVPDQSRVNEVLSLGVPSYESFEPARYAMGDTLRFASRMKLIEMVPRSDLSSTGYALANPGEEYLVLQPNEEADPFTAMVEAGTYAVEWFDITSRQTETDGEVSVGRSETTLFTPTERATGPMVLYLKRRTP